MAPGPMGPPAPKASPVLAIVGLVMGLASAGVGYYANDGPLKNLRSLRYAYLRILLSGSETPGVRERYDAMTQTYTDEAKPLLIGAIFLAVVGLGLGIAGRRSKAVAALAILVALAAACRAGWLGQRFL